MTGIPRLPHDHLTGLKSEASWTPFGLVYCLNNQTIVRVTNFVHFACTHVMGKSAKIVMIHADSTFKGARYYSSRF
jgi:hypothetical protein